MVSDAQNYQEDEQNVNTSLVPESEDYSEIDPNIIRSLRNSDYENHRKFVNTDESL